MQPAHSSPEVKIPPNGMLPPAIVLLGPTAAGKTDATLMIADRHPVEIISIDSANVYRDMDIGSAKPDPAIRARIPHHLIDLIDPTERYSAARFVEDACQAMQAIIARGNTPLLAGGTMLYYKALVEGLNDLPEADPAVRAAIEADAQKLGWPALHVRLAVVDPETAARLHPTDSQRIERALEVYVLTGQPMSAVNRRPTRRPELPARLCPLALVPADRAALHARIAQRFDAMLANGFIEEVIRLRARYALTADLPAMRAVGYRQAWQYLEGEITRTQLRDAGIAATRQLARRQMTWLRAMPEIPVFDPLASDATDAIAQAVEAFFDQEMNT